MNIPRAILLMGPTASGKTQLALRLAEHFPVEIVSVDSALIYQDMRLGTAKPSPSELARVPHHLIDIVPPTDSYSVARFRQAALQAMAEIVQRKHIPLLVGGTMLYFKALLYGLHDLPSANPAVRAELSAEGLRLGWQALHQRLAQIDPVSAQRLAPTDSQRIQRALEVYCLTGKPLSHFLATERTPTLPYHVLNIAWLPSDRGQLHMRIAQRFHTMLAQGLVAEVQALLLRYPSLTMDHPAMRCVGYRQVLMYLDGIYSETELAERGIFATRQLAKHQLTWLRRMPLQAVIDCWSAQAEYEVLSRIEGFLSEVDQEKYHDKPQKN